MRRALAAALLATTSACTTLPPLAPTAGEQLSGRLAIRIDAAAEVPARSFSAAFDLRGSASAGSLGLSTPLGSMLAQAQWSAAEVTLTTPKERRRYATLGELSAEALGESIPIEAWFDWLRGRPWPGATSTALEASTKFEQLGWS
ncbi:MAG: outer membrane lipoprotein LolB, partial [Pseudomonadota bacterium]|nr:outer membrane lipoprotein LolB [Pseudomonadota bacterium]